MEKFAYYFGLDGYYHVASFDPTEKCHKEITSPRFTTADAAKSYCEEWNREYDRRLSASNQNEEKRITDEIVKSIAEGLNTRGELL